jgi:uncharacterized protein (DUF305 family)
VRANGKLGAGLAATERGGRLDAGRRWRFALVVGLVTSTFSTLAVVVGAGRIGRDVPLSFMEIGTILLRWSGVRVQPTAREVLAGLAVHQGADIGWALVFFGLLGSWTLRLRPAALLALAPLWALATAAAEYWLILPWLQPLLREQTPYWVGLAVHVASALAYTVSFWLRGPLLGDERFVRFGRRSAAALGLVLALLAGLALLGWTGREPPSPGWRASGFDAAFMRQLAHHHDVGAELAELAAQRGDLEELRMLGRLMVAEQRAESRILRGWWNSWAGGALPHPSAQELAAMPGMPPPGALQELAGLEGGRFRARFVALMVPHHEGGIRMCREALDQADDPRLRAFAQQVLHAQTSQTKRLQGLPTA